MGKSAKETLIIKNLNTEISENFIFVFQIEQTIKLTKKCNINKESLRLKNNFNLKINLDFTNKNIHNLNVVFTLSGKFYVRN